MQVQYERMSDHYLRIEKFTVQLLPQVRPLDKNFCLTYV